MFNKIIPWGAMTICTLALMLPMSPAQAAPKSQSYACPADGYSFTVAPQGKNKLKLVDGAGNKVTLRRQAAASGEAFSGRDKAGDLYELSLKQSQAMLMTSGNWGKANRTDCQLKTSARPAARKATNYSCDNGSYAFSLEQTGPDSYSMVDGAGNKVGLATVPAASGQQLDGQDQDGAKISVSLKGREGMVMVDGKNAHMNCLAQ